MTVAIIEDKESDLEQIKDYCDELGKELGIDIRTIDFRSVKEFEDKINEVQPDLMVVDLRLGASVNDRSGWQTIKRVLPREIVPVIVYSAYSEEEPDAEFRNLLIARVTKGDTEVEKFKRTLTGLIRLKLRFNQEKERITKEFGKLSLETVREIFGEGDIDVLNESTLAIMAVGRLTSYLMSVPPKGEEKFPPESVFIYPPLQIEPYPGESLLLGDFLEEKESNNSSTLWLVISPSCDLAFTNQRKPKIEEVLLLQCYGNWREVPFLKDKGSVRARKGEVKDRLRRKTAKILKCPHRIFGSKYILVSFKDYKTVSYGEMTRGIDRNAWRKLATLATPYAESLQNLFIRDLSRIGTPETAATEDEEKWVEEFSRDNAS